jgi:hypothetical protein
VPEFFDAVVAALLERDPDDRPRDGFEVVDRLRRALEREADRGGRPSVASIPAFQDPETPIDASSAEESRRASPHLATVAFDRIAPLCALALSRLQGEHARAQEPGAPAEAALVQARKLVAMVADIARLTAVDAGEVDAVRARAAAAREEIGERLDELGRERSKALGWAGLLGDRGDVVRIRRHSGVDPIPMMEAMVWEEAALEQQEVEARDRVTELDEDIARLREEIDRENARLEHEVMIATARLEGRVAALRCIALEAWAALEEAKGRLRLPASLLDP